MNVTLSPVSTPYAARTSFGIVTCPFAITSASLIIAVCDMYFSLLISRKVGIS